VEPCSEVDHVAIVVEQLDPTLALLALLAGAAEVDRIARDDVTAVFVQLPGLVIEVIEVHDPAERTRRLGSARARIEHIALRVKSMTETLTALSKAGVETSGVPRTGRGRTAVFLNSATTHGIQYQLIEPAPGDSTNRAEY
jgi:Glyoxalase/Bleomycin resistance protein/Dioxygenase superfamily